jgi:hypothetical protein
MKKVASPVIITLVLACVITFALFFVAAAITTGATETVLRLGPLVFVRVAHAKLPGGGSTVSVQPGAGLIGLWLLLVGYGLFVGLRRYVRARVPSGSS